MFSKTKEHIAYTKYRGNKVTAGIESWIESEFKHLEKADFDDVINQFATVKSRKMNLL